MYAITLYLVEPKGDRALAEIDKAIGLDPQVILYPAFRCYLDSKRTTCGPVLRDLARCAAVLAHSRLRYYVTGDQKQNRFQVTADLLTHERCTLGILGRIDFERRRIFFAIGFEDDSKDSGHKNPVAGVDQQLINQNVLSLLAATFVGK